MRTILEIKCHRSLSKLRAYMLFFFQLCRHQRHLVFYAYSLSKEGPDAESLFCSCPQDMSRIWFMPFGVYIILKLGQNPHVTQLLKTWHFICHRIIVAVWVFLTSWQNNKGYLKELPLQSYSCAPLPQVGLRAVGTRSSLLCPAASTALFVLLTTRTSPLRRTEIRLRRCPAMVLPLSTAGILPKLFWFGGDTVIYFFFLWLWPSVLRSTLQEWVARTSLVNTQAVLLVGLQVFPL